MRYLTVLGATGSIGVNTLDVVARHPERFQVVALSAHTQVNKLFEQCCRFQPRYAVMSEPQAADLLRQQLASSGHHAITVLSGTKALCEIASLPEVDTVMAAMVGAAGLPPALAAAQAGKRILLANKETLVLAGHLFMEAVQAGGAQLLPIDSEHNAIFQSLPPQFQGDLPAVGVRKILLTASGGPFRTLPLAEFAHITPEMACKHPNWVMGRKISVDSATMMNKGLEVIEAHWLFNAPAKAIEVVIHPQSLIHSLVQYCDGSVLAQLGHPDMRTPIAHALAYPERIEAGVNDLNLAAIGHCQFEQPDLARFPCLGLAFAALNTGGTAAAILNAANEESVAAFLAGRLRFNAIADCNARALDSIPIVSADSVETLLAADTAARTLIRHYLAQTNLC